MFSDDTMKTKQALFGLCTILLLLYLLPIVNASMTDYLLYRWSFDINGTLRDGIPEYDDDYTYTVPFTSKYGDQISLPYNTTTFVHELGNASIRLISDPDMFSKVLHNFLSTEFPSSGYGTINNTIRPISTNKTLVFWVNNVETDGQTNFPLIVAGCNPVAYLESSFRFSLGNLLIESYAGDGDPYATPSPSPASPRANLTSGNISDGLWHQVILSINDSAWMYVDGAMSNYTEGIPAYGLQDNYNIWGFLPACGLSIPFYERNETFVDDLRVYNQSITSDSDIGDIDLELFNDTFFNSTSVTEGATSLYTLNISNSTTIPTYQNLTATYVFNGTNYALTDYYFDGDHFVLEASFVIPYVLSFVSDDNMVSYWNITFMYDAFNTTQLISINQSFILQNGEFALCNSSLFSNYLNFTFYDELNQSPMTADINLISQYYFSNRVLLNTSYLRTGSDAYNYSFCAEPENTYSSYYQLFYSNDGYPQRTYTALDATLTNTTPTEHKLYMLGSASGIYGRFQVMDGTGNGLSGVEITMTRQISGIWYTLEIETSDSSGQAAFWLDPDLYYTFTFVKAGYTSQTVQLRITDGTAIQIIMGGNGGGLTVSSSGSVGIAYTLYPRDGVLYNGTSYYFGANASSDGTWLFTNCTYNIMDENFTTIFQYSGGFSDFLCNINQSYNVGNYTYLYGQIVLIENSSYFLQYRKAYSVIYFEQGEFSIMSFVDDVKAFNQAGFNDFTRLILAFIIITAITFAICRGTGLADADQVVALIIVLVLAFSYLGFFTISLGTGDYSDGWINQYFMFVVILLLGSGFIMWRRS